MFPQKKNDPEGIRTLNLLIRSQTPYPLGHEAGIHSLPVVNGDLHLACPSMIELSQQYAHQFEVNR